MDKIQYIMNCIDEVPAKVVLVLSVLFVLGSCTDAPDFDSVPELTFEEIINSEIRQSTENDTVLIRVTVTDADGDLGRRSVQDTMQTLFLIDEYDGFLAAPFQLPEFPQQGIGKGIKAEATLHFIIEKGGVCCRQPNGGRFCEPIPGHPSDSLFYRLHAVDHAGHKSNEVRVGPIYLVCD